MADPYFVPAPSGDSIIKFNSGSDVVQFSAETERFTENYNGVKINSEIHTMVEMSGYAILRVYYSIDGGEYELADSILNSGFYSYPAVIKPRRCNSFKIKFEGFGDVKIHPMTRKMFVGSSVAPMGERALDWSQDENMSWDQLESFTWNELNHRRDP